MKLAIIGDIHTDKSEETIQEKVDVLESYFDNDCDVNVLLGDIFDSRKGASTIAVKKLQQLFKKTNKEIIIIVGNHDCRYKNTLFPNSIETSFKNIPNVTIIDKPTELYNTLFVPWICDSNYKECIDAIKTSKMKHCVGHFEIKTFLMSRGIECRTGLKVSDFKNFFKVFSGHFHLTQEKGNIIYVGSITQNTWTDFNNQKGYYIVDDEFRFVIGAKNIYKHLLLENNKSDFDIEKFKGCHVKIFHKEKLSKKQFDLIEELKYNVRSYQVFDESVEIIEKKIEKVEFTDVLDEFFEDQEMEDDFKIDVKEYLNLKYKEVS